MHAAGTIGRSLANWAISLTSPHLGRFRPRDAWAGEQPWRRRISLQQPNTAIAEVLPQATVGVSTEGAAPDHFCGIDVSVVVDPLATYIVVFMITD